MAHKPEAEGADPKHWLTNRAHACRAPQRRMAKGDGMQGKKQAQTSFAEYAAGPLATETTPPTDVLPRRVN